ncbi:MAG: hypothetical protein IJ974_02385 [Phascolarctobacterium sp.]|nr:hypothetical protein [Phascolarctobacterium sp.]MBR2219814.1 hypothetical protein [Phascolarctobacterium sp.]MBR6679018.1 hypothetical protein [Phascolarctobacterium sp.]
MTTKELVLGALLVAVAVILQASRLVLPLPPLLTTFIIGTLVNMMLVLCVRLNGFTSAAILSVLLPIFAYMQGQLLLPLLIPVVALGNLLFAFCVGHFRSGMLAYLLPATVKAVIMCTGAYIVIALLGIESVAMQKGILFAMSVPQLVTGIAGILCANKMVEVLKKKL